MKNDDKQFIRVTLRRARRTLEKQRTKEDVIPDYDLITLGRIATLIGNDT